MVVRSLIPSSVGAKGTNPTVEVLEKKLAALEGGAKAKLFAAGVAAISAAAMAFLQRGVFDFRYLFLFV